jgi:sulfate/thiosulfate transport system permease protein
VADTDTADTGTLVPEIQPGVPRARRRGAGSAAVGTGRAGTWLLRLIALFYLAFLLIIPVGLVFWRTFENGVAPVWEALTSDNALHALRVTLVVAGCAVLFNAIFGIVAAFLLVRHEFRGKWLLDKFIDLPLAVSPVVVGLALILVYGRNTTVGSWFSEQGFDIIYAVPGMVLATCFVSLPLMVREITPILEEIGDEQEQAAATLGATPFQTFRRITLPAIRWGVAYGIVLTLARSLGEFGAIAVVSGKIVGETQTLTLFVEQNFENFNQEAAYAAAFALAAMAILALLLMNLFRPKEGS